MRKTDLIRGSIFLLFCLIGTKKPLGPSRASCGSTRNNGPHPCVQLCIPDVRASWVFVSMIITRALTARSRRM
jgi:hypothetical protein